MLREIGVHLWYEPFMPARDYMLLAQNSYLWAFTPKSIGLRLIFENKYLNYFSVYRASTAFFVCIFVARVRQNAEIPSPFRSPDRAT